MAFRGVKISVLYYFIIQDFFQKIKIHLSGSEIITLKI